MSNLVIRAMLHAHRWEVRNQPYAPQAATIRAPGCNRTRPTLQPYVCTVPMYTPGKGLVHMATSPHLARVSGRVFSLAGSALTRQVRARVCG